jgi:hypothetical protein
VHVLGDSSNGSLRFGSGRAEVQLRRSNIVRERSFAETDYSYFVHRAILCTVVFLVDRAHVYIAGFLFSSECDLTVSATTVASQTQLYRTAVRRRLSPSLQSIHSIEAFRSAEDDVFSFKIDYLQFTDTLL